MESCLPRRLLEYSSHIFDCFTRAERCWYLKGEQRISKYNEVVKNTVELHIGVYRVPEFDTDILLSFNDPINIE